MLRNNRKIDLIKEISSLENGGILLKETARKNNSQEGVLLNFFTPLKRVDLPLMKNVLTPLAKRFLMPLGLTAVASGTDTDTAIQKKNFRSEIAASIFSNEKLDDIMKIVKSLEDSDLLIKGINETIENELKKK